MEVPVHGPDREQPRPRGKHALDIVLCLCLFLIALAAYLRTMRPTFGWGDPSELITAAYYLGVGHSPGYPTWILLAHPFSRLPIGDVAFRVNLFNALLGGLAISLLYLVYHRIAGSRIAAFVAALTFAFTATFWDITTETDVFTLHVCFAAIILLIALRWRRRPHDRWLYLLSGIIGISLGNHALTGLMIPALVYLVWSERGWRFFGWRRVSACAGLLLLGLSVYAYMPLRAPYNPPPHLNNPHSLMDFWAQLTAPGARQAMFDVGLLVPLERALTYLIRLSFEFSYTGCAIALLGSVLLWRRDRRLTIFFAIMALLAVAYASNFSIFDIYTYYLPLHIAWAALIAVGAAALLEIGAKLIARAGRGAGSLTPAWRYGLVTALLLALPAGLYANHFSMVDGSEDFSSERFAREVFRQVEPGAMILADWWTIAPLGYLKYIEGQRPDVVMFAAPSIYAEEGFIDFAKEDFLRRYPAVYFVEMLTYRSNLVRERFYMIPEGPVARVLVERPDPATVLADIPPTPMARFGDQVGFVRAEVQPGELRPGRTFPFTVYWTPLPDYNARPNQAIFVLTNTDGGRIWQESNLLGHDLYPLDQWEPGEVLREPHHIYVPDAVTAGEYNLLVRVREHGQAACLDCSSPAPGASSRDYLVARIRVGDPEPIPVRGRLSSVAARLRP
jgi:hypothetical protein